jgi:hypothetical protein
VPSATKVDFVEHPDPDHVAGGRHRGHDNRDDQAESVHRQPRFPARHLLTAAWPVVTAGTWIAARQRSRSWIAASARFWPHRHTLADDDSLPVEVFPNGDFLMFLTR